MTARAGSSIERPVIILGAPRSGTSLLADVLDAHPDVTVLREPRLVWRFGNDGRSDQLRVADARPEVVRHVRHRFAEALQEHGACRLVEKTPANTVRPHFIDAIFPDACYVHIVRDGWAAVPSIESFARRRSTGFDGRQLRKLGRRLREARPGQVRHYVPELTRRVFGGSLARRPLYGPRLAGLQAVVDELGSLEAAAMQWRCCVDSATAFGRALDPDRYLEVRLEHLDPATVCEILAFCRLRKSDEVLARFESAYRRDESLRRRPLSPQEVATLAPYVAPANAWLGYPQSVVSHDVWSG